MLYCLGSYTLLLLLLRIYELLLRIYEIVACLVSLFGTAETVTQIGRLMKTRVSHSDYAPEPKSTADT